MYRKEYDEPMLTEWDCVGILFMLPVFIISDSIVELKKQVRKLIK